jgi:hypothetical protein
MALDSGYISTALSRIYKIDKLNAGRIIRSEIAGPEQDIEPFARFLSQEMRAT